MTAAVLIAALAALPASADRRYRVEIGGEHAGWASLALTCGEAWCRATWRSALRAPAAAGGAILSRLIDADVEPDGSARRVRATIENELGTRRVEAGAGPVPAMLAELVLSAAPDGERRCVDVRDEASGAVGRACAARRGDSLEGEVLGVALRWRARPGEPPDELAIPAQRARFVADPEASLPERAPRLFGTRVAVAAGAPLASALRFCGVAAEPRAGPPSGELPRTFPDGASCREKTARYVALAERLGLRGRHVIGVAWDGEGFSWHEWAELLAAGEWVPVDPSFRQLPATGPRFALARYPPADEGARAAAGRAILSCWGIGRVEAAP